MSGLQTFLAVLLALLVAVHFLDAGDATQRNYEFSPDMVESPAYEAQDENPNWPDRKTLQPPPEGSIARGLMPLHVGEVMLDLDTTWKELGKQQQEAWARLEGPKPTPEDARRGHKIYRSICSTCHGMGGAGDGLVTRRGVPPPPSLLADNARNMSDGRMFRMITAGDGNMLPHQSQVVRADRWRVIAYVRSLQKQ